MHSLPKYTAENVWLAPMSGSTDAAFRRQVVRFGAPAVVSEMVAGESLAAARPDVVRRTCRHEGHGRWIVQLAARRPEDMFRGAQLLRQAGVDVIDINMGCPSRQVTGGNSGSALMREPELARRIIAAALDGANGEVPVTLKMRLGWDHDLMNAPEIARDAEAMGIRLIAVHGRTRCQFYKGQADWRAVANTVAAVSVPVIVNGDIVDLVTSKSAMEQSGAHGVMIGRAAMGEPWLPGQVAAGLKGENFEIPTLHEQCDSLCEQIEDSLALYGDRLGIRIVRKHVSASIDKVAIALDRDVRRQLRAQLCRMSDAKELIGALQRLYIDEKWELAA